ncbi:MAG: 23S rRNA (uracil(1939)-C(5))-methyltransferase RlmD [Melioribacter sp.]|uniref:23S rRNA (uracil(1939)-C(5))-methyltransferase RlmD n=1 Tax=Rosettibacter primus TaxID=3111523 RepID=UPI00247E352F|nr:23S rRNA (uracil(1939)-C(5))-methyltransferase RlmD [Melioribacter sp.]
MKKGDLIELEIIDYAFEGKGIAKIIKEVHKHEEVNPKKFVVFIDNSYPGDKIIAQLTKIKKTYAEGKIKEFIEKSPYRVEPRCKYFGTCGGCKQQNLDYKIQLKYKEEQVIDIFERIGGLSSFEINSIIPSEKIFFYRNKMEFSFATKRWITENEIASMQEVKDKDFALGLHIPNFFDKVLDIDECFLQSELSNKILNFSRKFFKQRNSSIYSTQTHSGFLRNLVIRQSAHSNDVMVNLVTSEENEKLMIEFRDELLNNFPEITTFVNNINKKKSQVATGDYEIVYHGSGYIYDYIGNYKFRISANSFFQTNTLQAEKLYKTAMNFALLKGDEVIYDLYSGAGTIPIFISKNAKEIYGFESVSSAVADANINIEINNVSNFEPLLWDLNKSLLPFIKQKKLPPPDIIIADPPRNGMNPKTINDILQLNPEKIIYISCNPATQARDIKLLCNEKYKLIKIQPIDMFPHTYHIENVALLKKIS